MKATTFYAAVLAATLTAACGDKQEAGTDSKDATQVAAKVNDTELTVHQVNHALQRIPNLDPAQSKAASLQIVRNLVEQELLAQKAIEEKLDRDPAVVQALDATRRQILAEAYMNRKLGTPGEPTDAEITEYFKSHPELFENRKVYRLQELAIRAPQDQHEKIRTKLAESRTLDDFSAWLKAEGIPAQASQGVKPAEQLPMELLPRLANMPVGQAIVVNAPEALMIVVLAGSQAQPVTLEQARPAIIRAIQTEARQKAAKAELDALKAAAKIEYKGEFVDAGKEPAKPAGSAPAEGAKAPAASAPAATAPAPGAPAATAPPSDAADADAEAISKGISGLK